MAQSAKPGEKVEKPILEQSTTHCTGEYISIYRNISISTPQAVAGFLPWDWRLKRKRKMNFQALYLKLEQESNLQHATQN